MHRKPGCQTQHQPVNGLGQPDGRKVPKDSQFCALVSKVTPIAQGQFFLRELQVQKHTEAMVQRNGKWPRQQGPLARELCSPDHVASALSPYLTDGSGFPGELDTWYGHHKSSPSGQVNVRDLCTKLRGQRMTVSLGHGNVRLFGIQKVSQKCCCLSWFISSFPFSTWTFFFFFTTLQFN